jgi:proline dehydrogenase
MPFGRAIFLRASKSRWLAERFMRRPFAKRAVKKFMPGEELADALQASRELVPFKMGTIITRLGESLTGESQADSVRDHYMQAYDLIAKDKLPVVVSVKPTQLGLDHSFDTCLAHLNTLAQKAVATNSQLWIDMEDSSYVDRTLDLYRRVKAKYEPVGLAMQAYLMRNEEDVRKLLDVKPIIRLVKGAYAEPPNVAYPSKKDVDLKYVSVGEQLLQAAAKGQAHPIFGTHDMTIISHLISRAGALGVKPGQYEIHMLYGIRMGEQKRLASEGHAVRCLISYGEKWFPWYMRRLAERPANVWFVARSMFMK